MWTHPCGQRKPECLITQPTFCTTLYSVRQKNWLFSKEMLGHLLFSAVKNLLTNLPSRRTPVIRPARARRRTWPAWSNGRWKRNHTEMERAHSNQEFDSTHLLSHMISSFWSEEEVPEQKKSWYNASVVSIIRTQPRMSLALRVQKSWSLILLNFTSKQMTGKEH